MLAAMLMPEHCSSGHCGKFCRWSHLVSSAQGQRDCWPMFKTVSCYPICQGLHRRTANHQARLRGHWADSRLSGHSPRNAIVIGLDDGSWCSPILAAQSRACGPTVPGTCFFSKKARGLSVNADFKGAFPTGPQIAVQLRRAAVHYSAPQL